MEDSRKGRGEATAEEYGTRYSGGGHPRTTHHYTLGKRGPQGITKIQKRKGEGLIVEVGYRFKGGGQPKRWPASTNEKGG